MGADCYQLYKYYKRNRFANTKSAANFFEYIVCKYMDAYFECLKLFVNADIKALSDKMAAIHEFCYIGITDESERLQLESILKESIAKYGTANYNVATTLDSPYCNVSLHRT